MEDAIALERCWDSEEATTKAVAQEAARQVNVFFESIYAELREKRIRHFLGLLKATPEELKRIGSSVIQIGFIDVWEKGIKKGFDRNQFNTIDEWLGFCVVCAVHGWRKGHRKRRIVTENGVMFSDPPSEDLLPAIELEISETARVITESCIKDDIDKAIVRMSIDGASVFEIAKYVELDPANVRRRRKKIADCVNSRMDTDE
ncbi:hypothetical protein FF011L_01710 [Roseimaritima multifibrata]|uniref:ECF sigma factor n=2 Tax=Roseimaritima multifibrata TaxID=1930274 RepID=A0A517M9E2_9BACT|nr:hypothetical protein FF011L_01710 [Roseimaritima multifibrata]